MIQRAPVFAISGVECEASVDEEHAASDDCRYQIGWTINPHMVVGSVDFAAARAQHAALRAALTGAGAALIDLPFEHGLYDSVFAKDPALLLATGPRRRALLARPATAERRPEQAARAASLARMGFEVIDEPGPSWEGGDVAVWPDGRGLLLGYGPRSSAAAAGWLAAHTGVAVTPIELVDAHLFHLDMAVAVLPDGAALACPEAMTARSLRALRDLGEVIEVDRAAAMAFGLNLVAVGERVILGADVPAVTDILRARGLRVIVAPLPEFHRAGGGAACLTTRVHELPSR